MAWFKKAGRPLATPKKTSRVPEGLWEKCPECDAILYGKDLGKNLHVCDKCGHHFRLGAVGRRAPAWPTQAPAQWRPSSCPGRSARSRSIATLPTGVQTGHLLLAWVVTNNLYSLNSTSGWTQIGVSRTQDSGVTNDSTIHRLYRDGLEGFSWTFTDLFNNTETGVIVISAWSGVDTSTPINTSASLAGSVLSTSVSGPSITPTLTNCMIVQLLGCDPSASTYSGTSDTSPVGTEIYDLADAGTYAYAAIQYYLQSTAAAIALDYTALTSDYYGRFQVALDEASGSAPAAPVATAATNIQGASFSANWNASTGATGYRLDVATDSGFTSFLTGYNNLDVGNVLTYSVSCSLNTTDPARCARRGSSGWCAGTASAP